MSTTINTVERRKIRTPPAAFSMLVKSTGTASDKNNHATSHTDAPDRQTREKVIKNNKAGVLKEDQRAFAQTALYPSAAKIPALASENISYIN
ncbi:hypothetical protein [Yoonia sp. MH D7]